MAHKRDRSRRVNLPAEEERQYAPESEYQPENEDWEDTYPQDPVDDEFEKYDDTENAETESERETLREKRSIFKPRTKKPAFVLSVAVNTIRILFITVILGGLVGLGAVVGIAKGYMETSPTLNLAAMEQQAQTSFIYDSNGKLITEYKGTENRVMVSLDAMPKYLQQAFIAVEDSRFYTHSGVDIKRIVGAFAANLGSGSLQGGSTITQQLIKNTVLSSEQSYKRKIQEAYLAMELETKYTKDEILECYMNTIWLGENYYGVQTAAEGYFGKSLSELTLRECAMLAGVANSPYYYNPRRNLYTRQKEGVDYPKITNDRTDYALYRMYQCQYITYEQYQEALNPATANVLTTAPTTGTGMYDYPHYVEYAISEVVQIFLKLEGLPNTSANRTAMENKLRTGGYHVKLAIDPDIQETVQDTISNWSRYPSLRDPSDKVFRQSNGDGTYTETIEPQAAAVVLDYRTGEIKAIIGSRNTPTARKTLNRATDMKMPVGSAIKPISVYAPALELGASPASIAWNIPVPISGWTVSGTKESWPRNYGGGSYQGPETLREAMKRSHNTAAAYTLMNMVGIERSVDFLHRMGIDDDHIDATPFGLSLGSSGITPMQMSVAYGVLANDGIYQTPISVLGISDSNGNVVWDGHANQERRRVFSDSTAYLIVDMLKTVVSGNVTAAKVSGQTIGGKTGTNSDQKGVCFSGISGYYSSCLWIGHDNYKALSGKSTGGGAAAPLWSAYMTKIHQGLSNRDIIDGDASEHGLVRVKTCAVSGLLATDACENDAMGYGTVSEWWASGTQPTSYCSMHSLQTICQDSGMLATAYCTNTASKGVTVIPNGHPLYRFIGTEYQSVLEEYLGEWVAVQVDSRGNAQNIPVCTYHTSNYGNNQGSESVNPIVENTLIPGAQVLLEQARRQLATIEPGTAAYQNLESAMSNLEYVIAQPNATQTEVAGAMSLLTRTMAGY